MKKSILLLVLLFFTVRLVLAQDDKKGLKSISVFVGPSFSNFINAEVPRKINLYELNVANSSGYYETNFLKDVRLGVSVGFGFEYYLKKETTISFSLSYEEKGSDLSYYKRESSTFELSPNNYLSIIPDPQTNIIYYDEIYDRKISNDYLTLSILMKRYVRQTNFYFQSGVYTSYLLQSHIYMYERKHEYIPNYDFYGSDYKSKIDRVDDEKKYTMNFDFGISLGTGYLYPISERFLFNVNLIANFGLIKVEKQYREEGVLRPANYYGLNTNIRNINSLIAFGIVYKL